MADAKPGVHVVKLKPICVPVDLQEGNKFIKWDDDSTVGTPVTLRVDKNGFFLYWINQNKETEFLEVSSIRDTRSGRSARIPKDGKLRDSVNMGAQDIPLEDKTLTVVFGPDFVNINYINFCCNNRTTILTWRDALLDMAYNLLASNASNTTFLEKAYTKIHLSTDKEGKIPVKNVIRMFAQNKDDKKRVEKALDAAELPSEKSDCILPQNFTFQNFMDLYKNLTNRKEVETIFEQLCGNHKKKYLTVEQLVNFLKEEQTDPRLNEMLHPYPNAHRAKEIIIKYEPIKSNVQKVHLSFDGFLNYLMGDENTIIPPRKLDLYADMDQSLNHYFINSSHNTYLTGHQLTGRSSIEMYRQSLLAGCRCIELDCWNGKMPDEEPIITHGYTVVSDIILKEVLEAIAESAFKTSPFPVILSFENHCSPRQQARIASYCQKILGDALLTEPLSSHPVKPGQPLPSLNSMLRKIIIKNKKKHHHRAGDRHSQCLQNANVPNNIAITNSVPPVSSNITLPNAESNSQRKMSAVLQRTTSDESQGTDSAKEGAVNNATDVPPSVPLPVITDDVHNVNFEESDTEMDSEDEEVSDFSPEEETRKSDQGTAGKESEAGAEMSALVNYVQPVRFHSFEHADRRNRSYEISSFVETQSTNLLKEHPVEFVNYNKRQLSRVYPRGTRVDSSNYMPQVFWNAGCQLVALNFQTLDLAMQLNLGIFEYNGRSGYLLKPDFMRRTDRKFDPFTESTVDGIIAGTVSIKVISGQFLTDKRVGTYVEVDMYGLPADTVRRRFKTKLVPQNGINPIYDEDPFVFKKVVLPDLACVRITVCDESGRFIGHRVLPVSDLRPGYRHVSLKNESGQPLMLPSIFVHIMAKDYVPDGLSALADALANPIEYQSKVEKHALQLSKLTDEYEEKQTNIDGSPNLKKSGFDASISPNSSPSKDKTAQQAAKNDSMDSGGSGAGGPLQHDKSMNGSLKRSNTVGSGHHTSPGHKMVRQDTTHRLSIPEGMTPCIRNASEEGSFEKATSLLESTGEVMTAETVEKIKESRLVTKIVQKVEKESQVIRKKHEKAKEKERELQQIREAKLVQSLEKQKVQFLKAKSKMARKLSKASGNQDISSLKRQSDADMDALSAEHLGKIQELHKTHNQTMHNLFRDQYKSEQEVHEKCHKPYYNAVDRAMQLSQSSQLKFLQSLHDKEVAELMAKLESQTREQLKNLSKKHKDKSELARVKRELHQKHIEMAVSERQRFMDLYKEKETELKKQHDDIKKQISDEKEQYLSKLAEEMDAKCSKMISEYEENVGQANSGNAADSTVL